MVTNRDRKSFGLHQKNSKFAHMTGTIDVFDLRSGISRTTAESFCMSKSSWMMGPSCSRKMPSCSAIDLAEIWQSSKISW